MMRIRKATGKDIDSVAALYERIHSEEESGRASIGWVRGVYPTRETAEEALRADDLFVMEDKGAIVAAARINQSQVPAYAEAHWSFQAEDGQVMVLHTLVVDPLQGGRGYGKAFVAFYERYAKQKGAWCLRMDTNAVNTRARNMYAALGYREADIVPCVFNGIPDVKLVCLEKILPHSPST